MACPQTAAKWCETCLTVLREKIRIQTLMTLSFPDYGAWTLEPSSGLREIPIGTPEPQEGKEQLGFRVWGFRGYVETHQVYTLKVWTHGGRAAWLSSLLTPRASALSASTYAMWSASRSVRGSWVFEALLRAVDLTGCSRSARNFVTCPIGQSPKTHCVDAQCILKRPEPKTP